MNTEDLRVAQVAAERIAAEQSADGCVQHVNALIAGGRVVGFVVSDWYGPDTVSSWCRGVKLTGGRSW